MCRQVFVFLLLLAFTGCTDPLPHEARARALTRAMEQALNSRDVEIRVNPTGCQCPDFEIRVGDRWVRVAFSPDPDAQAAASTLRAELQQSEGPSSRLVVLLLESGTPRYCANSSPYFEVSLVPGQANIQ